LLEKAVNQFSTLDAKADRLDSWKEIAAYLGREIRTVQLWEKAESLPIHRHVHKSRGTVHAFRSELDSWRFSRQSSSPQFQNRVALVVMPFENLGHKRSINEFSEGLSEDLITNLGRLQPERLFVVARPNNMPIVSNRASLHRLARQSKADYILVGSVRTSRDRLRVCAQLIRASDMTYIWADSFEERASEMLVIQSSIASRITRSLVQILLLRANFATSSIGSAFEAYLRGRYFWNKRTNKDLNRAVSYFEQAISTNPNCGLAYVGLADTYCLLGIDGQIAPTEAGLLAKSAATRALQIDGAIAEAYVSLGEARFGFDWDWDGAEQSFKRALQLDSAYPTAHHWYGNFLSIRGRHQEALIEIRQAHQLDPLSLIINVWLGVILQHASKYDEAIQQYRRALELDPNFTAAHAYLGLAYEQKGACHEAISSIQKALSLSGGHIGVKAMLGHTYAASGMREQAQLILNELEGQSGRGRFAPTDVAILYAGLGDRQNALNWLERAYEEHSPNMVLLKVDPRFAPLRSESRYQSLLRRITLSVH
jgi:TolB-like protein/Flp pilus assembly protein TadD